VTDSRVGDSAQHRRGTAQVAEALDPHRVSVTESYRLMVRGTAIPASFSGLRMA
jgi:hypothetical protein